MQTDWIERNVTPDDAKGIVQIYRNYWWWCVDGDPKRAVFYRPGKRSGIGSAQCNFNKEISENVGARLGYLDQGMKLVQIPLALVPWED